jgi:hypothetical protein
MITANRMQGMALALAVLGGALGTSWVSAGHDLASLDADHDGRLSRAEHAKALQADFARIDSNRNGVLSAPEMGTWLRSRGASPRIGTVTLGAQEIATIDGDRDGRVSAVEHGRVADARFAALDGDRDGTVTGLEWRIGQSRIEPDARMAVDIDDD